jgi:hypothetical protein
MASFESRGCLRILDFKPSDVTVRMPAFLSAYVRSTYLDIFGHQLTESQI